jgi:hypothetical protein
MQSEFPEFLPRFYIYIRESAVTNLHARFEKGVKLIMLRKSNE